MEAQNRKPNRLIGERSPYLLQHAHNPVDWYPWGDEAFEKARAENKPVFLSVGYSACHWCHVMARESFEDDEVARYLNARFVSVKVDREERPDVDGIYMRACQALTGGGGWPASVFLTAGGEPFYAGTYFPKDYFLRVLRAIAEKWESDRPALLHSGREIVKALGREGEALRTLVEDAPVGQAVSMFRSAFDGKYGGFGVAPKFPSPHNLMFLLHTAPELAEKTLEGMYRGGIFDHVGGGFCRYSTDRYWLIPHFEKMLCDNALLAMAYLLAFERTGNDLWKAVAAGTLRYAERELMSPEGGFYSSQDADSDGVEGKYYAFTPDELVKLLGREDGERFCLAFGITETGNFEGKSIPNLLGGTEIGAEVRALLPKVYEYRRSRTSLRTDRKILTSWNALMAAANADAYRILGEERYLRAAQKTVGFLESRLTGGDTVYSGITDGKLGPRGFLDDYAFCVFALLHLHQATLEQKYLDRADQLADKAVSEFFDGENGGFFFSGAGNERLIIRPKETYDGALPSGNSVMAYNLLRLSLLTEKESYEKILVLQRKFMNAQAQSYPSGYGFYLYSTLPVRQVVCAPGDREDLKKLRIRSDWAFRLADDPRYPLKNGRTTFYVCRGSTCLPPVNELDGRP